MGRRGEKHGVADRLNINILVSSSSLERSVFRITICYVVSKTGLIFSLKSFIGFSPARTEKVNVWFIVYFLIIFIL